MLDIFHNKSIKRPINSANIPLKQELKQKKTIPNASSSEFKGSILNHIFESEFNGEIDSFMEDLELLQKKMINKPSLALVQEYRQKIGFFLEKILSHYQGHSYFKGGLQKRVELKIWHSINEELEQLSKTLISKNVEGFTLLKRLGVIKGLILDLKIGKG